MSRQRLFEKRTLSRVTFVETGTAHGLRTALAQTMSEASVSLAPALLLLPIGIGLDEVSCLFVAQPDDLAEI